MFCFVVWQKKVVSVWKKKKISEFVCSKTALCRLENKRKLKGNLCKFWPQINKSCRFFTSRKIEGRPGVKSGLEAQFFGVARLPPHRPPMLLLPSLQFFITAKCYVSPGYQSNLISHHNGSSPCCNSLQLGFTNAVNQLGPWQVLPSLWWASAELLTRHLLRIRFHRRLMINSGKRFYFKASNHFFLLVCGHRPRNYLSCCCWYSYSPFCSFPL